MSAFNINKLQGYEYEDHFSNCKIPSVNTEGRLMAINDKFLAMPWNNPGVINIANVNNSGDLSSYNLGTYNTENSNILDMEFSPFNSNILALVNDNNSMIFSKIPEDFNSYRVNSTSFKFHKENNSLINFNPIVSNLICSCSENGELLISDVEKLKLFREYNLTKSPNAISWSPDGALIGIITKSKFFHIVDPRSKGIILNKQINEFNNNSKFSWVDTNIITCTTWDVRGYRYLKLLDRKKYNFFTSTILLDKNNLQITPYVDQELKIIYSIGKDDNYVKVFDYSKGTLQQCLKYRCNEHNKFTIQLNRKFLNKEILELDKFASLTKNNNIIYVGFTFDNLKIKDFGVLYPNEELSKTPLISEQWFSINNSEFNDKINIKQKASENNDKTLPQDVKNNEQKIYNQPTNNRTKNNNIIFQKSGIVQKYKNNNKKVELKNPNISSPTKFYKQEKQESSCNSCISLKKQIQELEANKKTLISQISSLEKNIQYYKNKCNEPINKIKLQNYNNLKEENKRIINEKDCLNTKDNNYLNSNDITKKEGIILKKQQQIGELEKEIQKYQKNYDKKEETIKQLVIINMKIY